VHSRRLAPKDAQFFLSALVSRGGGRWEDGANGGAAAGASPSGRVLVYWRSPAAWGDLIYAWVEATARNGTVMTLYEVRMGEDARGQGASRRLRAGPRVVDESASALVAPCGGE